MKIYNTHQYNYANFNKQHPQTSFNAKIRITPEANFLHDIDKRSIDGGLMGFLRGKPFRSVMKKIAKIYPNHIVEFSYKPPLFYGFNYIKGDGMAQSSAKLLAKNLSTKQEVSIDIDGKTLKPFYSLASSLIKNTQFWTK